MRINNDEELLKISRRQLKMLKELIELQIDAKIAAIPVIDNLELGRGLGVGEVKVIRTQIIKRIF